MSDENNQQLAQYAAEKVEYERHKAALTEEQQWDHLWSNIRLTARDQGFGAREMEAILNAGMSAASIWEKERRWFIPVSRSPD